MQSHDVQHVAHAEREHMQSHDVAKHGMLHMSKSTHVNHMVTMNMSHMLNMSTCSLMRTSPAKPSKPPQPTPKPAGT